MFEEGHTSFLLLGTPRDEASYFCGHFGNLWDSWGCIGTPQEPSALAGSMMVHGIGCITTMTDASIEDLSMSPAVEYRRRKPATVPMTISHANNLKRLLNYDKDAFN
eukprot:9315811-Pyramimonas_sp.AAC.1